MLLELTLMTYRFEVKMKAPMLASLHIIINGEVAIIIWKSYKYVYDYGIAYLEVKALARFSDVKLSLMTQWLLIVNTFIAL